MKNYILLFALGVLAACGGTDQPALSENDQRIAELESIVYTDTTGRFDAQIALELAALYTNKVRKEAVPDSVAVDLHFKSGELYMNAGKSNLAIRQFDIIVKDHPNSDKVGASAFMKGFVAETVGGDEELAKKNYQEFIEKFPDHHLADDAQFSIDNLGLTDGELLERIRSKNQQ